MRCPFCFSELQESNHMRYQNTYEHVTNPNGTPTLKPTFVCTKHPHVFWDDMGALYISPLLDSNSKINNRQEWKKYPKTFNLNLEHTPAVFSWQWEYSIRNSRFVRMIVDCKLFWHYWIPVVDSKQKSCLRCGVIK